MKKGSCEGSPLLRSERTSCILGDGEDGSDVCINLEGIEKGRPKERVKPIMGDWDRVEIRLGLREELLRNEKGKRERGRTGSLIEKALRAGKRGEGSPTKSKKSNWAR